MYSYNYMIKYKSKYADFKNCRYKYMFSDVFKYKYKYVFVLNPDYMLTIYTNKLMIHTCLPSPWGGGTVLKSFSYHFKTIYYICPYKTPKACKCLIRSYILFRLKCCNKTLSDGRTQLISLTSYNVYRRL